MESFTLFRKLLAISGIIEQKTPSHLHRYNSTRFNLKNSTIIIFGNLYVISLTKLLDEVSTFEEYMSIIYLVLSSFVLIVSYTIIVFKTPELFGLVKSFEDIIAKSTYIWTTRRIYFHS